LNEQFCDFDLGSNNSFNNNYLGTCDFILFGFIIFNYFNDEFINFLYSVNASSFPIDVFDFGFYFII